MEELELFCVLDGAPRSVFSVVVDADKCAGDLKDAIKEKKKTELKDVEVDKLQLFLTKKGDISLGEGVVHVLVVVPKVAKRPAEDERIDVVLKKMKTTETKLGTSDAIQPKILAFIEKLEHKLAAINAITPQTLGSFERSKRPADDEVLKILKLIEPKTLTDFKKLSVCEDEFQLDDLSSTRQSRSSIVTTPDLYKFWEGFGGFPEFYFVRVEECVFWEVIKKLLFGKERVVIVGSPGVGKSCFLMLLAFYLACIKKMKVLVIRHLKNPEAMNAVVYFDGQGSYARLTNLSSQDINAIRDQAQGAIVLVDGFDQAELNRSTSLLPFHFRTTSCQFDAKADDSSHIVVLPAWREAELREVNELGSRYWFIQDQNSERSDFAKTCQGAALLQWWEFASIL